jgi:uncharacterized protein with PQ loop repeat
MIKKNTHKISLVAIGLILGSLPLFSVYAITLDNPLGNTGDFPTLISNIATYVRNIVAALAVLMFLWAGILFITAGVFNGNYDKGKQALWYAVIGLAIALAASGLIEVIRQVIGVQS